MENNLWYFEFH